MQRTEKQDVTKEEGAGGAPGYPWGVGDLSVLSGHSLGKTRTLFLKKRKEKKRKKEKEKSQPRNTH